MHSHIGPWQEAKLVYVSQARLAERLLEAGPELVLYDLGMGIAANALAAAECVTVGAEPARALRIISFEKHLDGLGLALDHEGRFDWVARHRAQLLELLANRECRFQVGRLEITWQLVEGDILKTDLEELPRAEVMFFDFYSPKADPKLWGARCFQKLHAAAGARALLLTYSASTAARAALLLGGWSVGAGVMTGAKFETTAASIHPEDLALPLGRSWLEKLERSEKPLPSDWDPGRREEAFARIHAARQFAKEYAP